MLSSAVRPGRTCQRELCQGGGSEGRRTFEQLAPVDLAGSDLERNDVTLDKCYGVSGGSMCEARGRCRWGWYT